MENLKKNSEGYPDPTAYNAIRNLEGAEHRPQQGEIWYIGQTKRELALIIAVQEKYCNIITLRREALPQSIQVFVENAMYYADPTALSYCLNYKFNKFVWTCDEDDFRKIIEMTFYKFGMRDFPTTQESPLVSLVETLKLKESYYKEKSIFLSNKIMELEAEIYMLKATN